MAMALLFLSLTLFAVPSAFGAANTATGDIGGTPANLIDSAAFNLSTTTLAVMKTAFLESTGLELTDGDVLPIGTVVNFLIYIDNTTPIQVDDISLADTLVTATFNYTAESMRVLNTTDSTAVAATTVQNIYDAVRAVPLLGTNDGVNGDVASFTTPNFTVGDETVANGTLNVAASKVWALLYTVTMQ